MAAYEDVRAAWTRASRDSHVGMSDAMAIVAAGSNSNEGRRALQELLADSGNVALVEPDALSYLRISRDLPLPAGVDDHRADAFFRTRCYTGTRVSKTHRVANPREFLYFDFAIVMLTGTLDEVPTVRRLMEGSGYEPVLAHMPGGGEHAIGIVMVNEFRDTTFGPYDEVIFIVTSVPEGSPRSVKSIDYVNPLSLQVPLDRGATTYTLKLWLNQLSPIDGGNDYLGTNKELGSFAFTNTADGRREFRCWDRELKELVSGTVPCTASADASARLNQAYHHAVSHAGSTLPDNPVRTIPVASRPDSGGPATPWGFTVDWRRIVFHTVSPGEVGLRFGEAAWGRLFESLGFTPALSFYAPSGVGEIVQNLGDCAYEPR